MNKTQQSSGINTLTQSPGQNDDLYSPSDKNYENEIQNTRGLQSASEKFQSEIEKASKYQDKRINYQLEKKKNYESEIDNMRQVMNDIEYTIDNEQQEVPEIYQKVYKQQLRRDSDNYPPQEQGEEEDEDNQEDDVEESGDEDDHIKPKYQIKATQKQIPRQQTTKSFQNDTSKESSQKQLNLPKQQKQYLYHEHVKQIQFEQLLQNKENNNLELLQTNQRYVKNIYESSQTIKNQRKEQKLDKMVNSIKQKVRNDMSNPNKKTKQQFFQPKYEGKQEESICKETFVPIKRGETEINSLGHRRQYLPKRFSKYI